MKKLLLLLLLSIITLISCSSDSIQEDIETDPIETPIETKTAILYVESYFSNGYSFAPRVSINGQELSFSRYQMGTPFIVRTGDIIVIIGYIDSFTIDNITIVSNYGINNNYYLQWIVN